MAEEKSLFDYISEVSEARNGAEMRRPLINALKFLNEKGRNVETLNMKTSDYFAKQSDMGSLLPMDPRPKYRSNKLATSGGVFAMIGDMDDFDWGEDDWLI